MKTELTESEHLQLIALLTCAKQKSDEAQAFERGIKSLLNVESDGIGDIDHLSDWIWCNDTESFQEAIRRAGITVKESAQ